MSVTKDELERFHEFATQQLDNGGAQSSLEELVNLWRKQRERAETVDDIRQGSEDYRAGNGQPLTEALDEVRRDLGLLK